MSDTHAQTVAYARDTMLPPKDPPRSEVGAVKWLRENLFSGWINILLTLISLWILWWIVTHLGPWFLNSVWNAGSLGECREVLAAMSDDGRTSGACFAVVRDRWVQLLFGFYPPAYFWRSIVALGLLFVALMPVLFPDRVPRAMLVLTFAFPFAMPWLLWGGSFWVPVLAAAGFGVGWLAFAVLARVHSSLLGVIGAILAAVLWWLVAMPMVNDALHKAVASPRIESARAEKEAEVVRLADRIAALETEQAEVNAAIAEAVARKDEDLARLLPELFRRNAATLLPEAREAVSGLTESSTRSEIIAAFAEAREILSPLDPAQAAADLAVPFGDARTTIRARIPATEDGSVPPEVLASLDPLRVSLDEAIALTATPLLDQSEVDTLRADLMAQMRALTELRERTTSLGSDIFRLGESRRAAQTLIDNIDRLSENLANLPAWREEAQALRAALPEPVAALTRVPEDLSLYEPDEVTALRAALRAEEQVINADNAVTSTYGELGRVGLDPVPSTSFGGFQLSLIIGLTGIVMSLPLGILLALGRQSNLLIINKISVTFIEVIRGVPLIVWLLTAQFLLNYFLPPGTTFDIVLRVLIMVTLFASAYIAEVVRGGLAALPKGQYEAADALGLDYWKSMRLIILPQALKISIPGIVNTFIGLFKDTTLVVFIGLLDPLGLAGSIRASTEWNGIYWELFIFIGLLFFVFCFGMGRYSMYLERRLRREHR